MAGAARAGDAGGTPALSAVRDGRLGGAEALERLAAEGRYLFHGSPHRLDVLEPRQPGRLDAPGGEMVEDGAPAVCCSDTPAIAAFMAVFGAVRRASGVFGYTRKPDGVLRFYASAPALEAARDARAYVHVVSREGFSKYREDEWRRPDGVEALAVVEVTREDVGAPVLEIARPEDFPAEA